MPFGFKFGERDQVLFKRKYVALFWLLELGRRNAFLQGLPQYGKSRKKRFTLKNVFFYKFDTGYTSMT